MKSVKILIAFILFIIVLPVYTGAANLGELRLSYIDGDVQINTEDTGEWVRLRNSRSGMETGYGSRRERTEIQARMVLP
jgi:hypothetical protein